MHAPDGARAASGLTNFRWAAALGRNVKLWGGLADGFGVSLLTTRVNDVRAAGRFERAMSGTVTTPAERYRACRVGGAIAAANVHSDPAMHVNDMFER